MCRWTTVPFDTIALATMEDVIELSDTDDGYGDRRTTDDNEPEFADRGIPDRWYNPTFSTDANREDENHRVEHAAWVASCARRRAEIVVRNALLDERRAAKFAADEAQWPTCHNSDGAVPDLVYQISPQTERRAQIAAATEDTIARTASASSGRGRHRSSSSPPPANWPSPSRLDDEPDVPVPGLERCMGKWERYRKLIEAGQPVEGSAYSSHFTPVEVPTSSYQCRCGRSHS